MGLADRPVARRLNAGGGAGRHFQGKLDTIGTVRQFLGVRYAQPVTFNLRWKPPQPVDALGRHAGTRHNSATIVRRGFTPYGKRDADRVLPVSSTSIP